MITLPKIVICGSMAFAQEMIDFRKKLEERGFDTVVPSLLDRYIQEGVWKERTAGWGTLEGAQLKIERNLIKVYYDEISKADAILVINKDKDSINIKNYIGGNTFLEMGFAHILGKKIYCLNPLPEDLKVFYQELVAMQPIILNGDLSKIEIKFEN